MSRDQRTRLERLQAAVAPPRGGVIHMQTGETPEQAAARAIAAGRIGPFVVMPAPMSIDEWEREAIAQQRDLAQRAEVFFATGRTPDET